MEGQKLLPCDENKHDPDALSAASHKKKNQDIVKLTLWVLNESDEREVVFRRL
jgi:hypothetical protein